MKRAREDRRMMQKALTIAVAAKLCGCVHAGPMKAPPAVTCTAGDTRFQCLVGAEAFAAWDRTFREDHRDVMAIFEEDVMRSVLLLLIADPGRFQQEGFKLPPAGPQQLFEALHEPPPPPGALQSAEDLAAKESCLSRLPPAQQAHVPSGARYYNIKAHHARTRTNENPERAMGADFYEELHLVRVQLPLADTEVESKRWFDTNIGRVDLYPSIAHQRDGVLSLHHGQTVGDGGASPTQQCSTAHWYGSVAQLKADFAELANDNVTRVDLVTMAAIRGYHFAAIGFYLVYTDHHTDMPAAYVVEAGTATGYARQAFLSRRFASEHQEAVPPGDDLPHGPSTYNPTGLSSPTNTYRAVLYGEKGTDGEWDPRELLITSKHEWSKDPYITITGEISRNSALESQCESPVSGWGPKHYSILVCRAAAKVAAIEHAAGEPHEVVQGLGPLAVAFCSKFTKEKVDKIVKQWPVDDGHPHPLGDRPQQKCQ